MAQTDKLASFVEDIRRSGVECLPPDVNASRADFSVDDGKVRYALGALKGVGEKAMEALVAEREANGPYKSLDDFAERIDPKLLNRRQLKASSGALTGLIQTGRHMRPPRRSLPMQQPLTTSGPAASMACLAVAAKVVLHRSAFPRRALDAGRADGS
jgi:hypothetical protein